MNADQFPYFLWNVDETWVGTPKRKASPNVIVAEPTKSGIVTIPEEKDGAQVMLITAISAFGDSPFPMLISETTTVDKIALEAQ
jgi:hypothetical protein